MAQNLKNSKIFTHTHPQNPTQNRTKKYRLALGIMPKRWAVSLCNTENLLLGCFGAAGRDRSGVHLGKLAGMASSPSNLPCIAFLHARRESIPQSPKRATSDARGLVGDCLPCVTILSITKRPPGSSPGGHIYVVWALRPAGGIPALRAKEKPQASAQGLLSFG